MIERLYRVSTMSLDSCRTLTCRHKCVNTLNETSYIASEGLRDLAEFSRYSYMENSVVCGVESESYLRNKASIFHSMLRSFWLDLNISSLFMRKQRSDGWARRTRNKNEIQRIIRCCVNSISRMMRTGLASKYQSSCVSFGFFHHKKSRVVVNSISFGFRTHTHAYLHFHCALLRNFTPKLPAIFNHLIISHKTLLAYANMGTGYETSFFTALQISRERRLQFLVI